MGQRPLLHEELTRSVLGAFFEVYRHLDYGYGEHLYVMALERELRCRGHQIAREYGVIVYYKGEELGQERLDLVVDGKLIVEVKATERLHPSAHRQLISYLKSTRLEVGLLLHFGPIPRFHRYVQLNGGRPYEQT
jgi:GxxExxY protein